MAQQKMRVREISLNTRLLSVHVAVLQHLVNQGFHIVFQKFSASVSYIAVKY